MRRKNQEITNQNEIEEILRKSNVCRIAMIDNNIPYIVPLNYGFKENVLYFHSANEGKKIDILKRNNNICFEIEEFAEIIKDEKPCKWSTKYKSVIGYGKVEFIDAIDEKKKALDIIMLHNGIEELKSYDESQVKSIAVMRIQIDSMTAKRSNH